MKNIFRLLVLGSSLFCGACASNEDIITNVASREVHYATRVCTEQGVDQNSPEWDECLRQKGAARWALKNCGETFLNMIPVMHPTLCARADDI